MKKVFSLLLVTAMLFSMFACGGGNKGDETYKIDVPEKAEIYTGPSTRSSDEQYTREDDGDVYERNLAYYNTLLSKAKEASNLSEKFVIYAKAEAWLLDLAVMLPTTTQGGNYSISRVAPRTVPYVQWGNDDDRVKSLVISDEFLTKEERSELLDQWSKAVAGEGTYDPAAYLTGKGHTLSKTYTTTFSTAPVTFDWLNTSSQSDTEVTVNTVDGLVEYNNLNQMKPALAESWSISEDGKTYTFNIRQGVKWVTSDGTAYADVTAKDFEAGFHHMLDGESGLQWLVEGVVTGVTKYVEEGGSYDNVGYKATSDYVLTVTLEAPTSYFLTMLTYSCFLPICESFYAAHGGVYGIDALKDAKAGTGYTFGLNTDVSSQVYCGSHRITKFSDSSEIVLTKNESYYRLSEVTMDTLKWVYDDGKNPTALYNEAVKGTYPGIGLSEASGLLQLAKDDGNFEKYSYVTDTTSTTYFGGLNLNRGTYALTNGAVASAQTESQKIDAHIAMQNQNFRKAVLQAVDKATINAISVGDELKLTCLRNMYTHPQFVSLSEDVTYEGKTWSAGTFYVDIVQWYLEQLGSTIKVADGVNGWYDPDTAKASLEAAKTEIGQYVTFPINIDIVYLSGAKVNTAQAQAYKASIEGVLGAENVVVNLIEATTTEDYHASGYRAASGEAGNFDLFYGSGWGPDFGDPCTYLDTFLGYGAGYMTKVIGLF